MKIKNTRLEAVKMLVSSRELSSQEEMLAELRKEGFVLTQATLSRDLKQLQIGKARGRSGRFVYVMPTETMYKRLRYTPSPLEMLQQSGFLSLKFSGNIAVMKTRPGYAGSIAYNIDEAKLPQLLGTVAGDDTLLLVTNEESTRQDVIEGIATVLPEIKEWIKSTIGDE